MSYEPVKYEIHDPHLGSFIWVPSHEAQQRIAAMPVPMQKYYRGHVVTAIGNILTLLFAVLCAGHEAMPRLLNLMKNRLTQLRDDSLEISKAQQN